jgi:hypothetical protein
VNDHIDGAAGVETAYEFEDIGQEGVIEEEADDDDDDDDEDDDDDDDEDDDNNEFGKEA